VYLMIYGRNLHHLYQEQQLQNDEVTGTFTKGFKSETSSGVLDMCN
jgi:hypothetical protein